MKIKHLDFFTLSIASISLASVLFLVLNKFDPILSFIVGCAIAFLIFKILKLKFSKKQSIPWVVVVIMLIGLVFRYQPYQYVLGGQDEGVYFNMSYYYKDYGSNFVQDNLYKLYNNFGLKSAYKNTAYNGKSYLPGIYAHWKTNKDFVFQFYPLHPLWMSIFLGLTNHDVGVYALTMFSLLSILYSYLLTKEIFNNKYAGYLSAWFLAIHPVHAYFSKFPVTELVALFFTFSSFYYLVKYFRSKQNKPFYLTLSSMLMISFFFTRISGFMYIPFFYLLTLLVIAYLKDKRQLLLYIGSIFMGYTFSVFYGLFYTPYYSHDIYKASFSQLFGHQWEKPLFISLIFSLLFLIIFYLTSKLRLIFKKLVNITTDKLHWIFYTVLLLAGYRAYTLAFTHKYVNNITIHGRWKMDGLGLGSLHFSNLIVVINYLSPFLFLLFLIGVYSFFSKGYKHFFSKEINILSRLLLVFIILFWIFGTVIKFTTPYQYYYGRYLISELVPYTFIFTFGFLVAVMQKSDKFIKSFVCIFIFTSSLFFLFITLAQHKKPELLNTFNSLEFIVKNIDSKDLIILDQGKLHSATWTIKTALMFTFDRQVINVINQQKLCEHKKAINIISDQHDVFFISNNTQQTNYLDLIEKDFLESSHYVRTRFFPRAIFITETPIYIYRLDNDNFNVFCSNFD